MDPITKEDERAEWLTEHGWNWQPINPVKRKPKGTQYFRYGSLELLRPHISVYRS